VQGQISSSVRAVTKVLAGELIELARQVQTEYVLAGEKQTDLPKPEPGTEAVDGADETERRGPLRPEHLREAWRRYQRSGEGRGVGTQQLWHAQQGDGVDRFSTRTGKRLFR
jgi:transcription initiation factor TFIID subunit 11